VAVVGFGTVQGGHHLHQGADDLVVEAATRALQEAGLEIKDIQAGWTGTLYGALGGSISRALKMGTTPITRVLNDTATGGDVFRNASLAVAAGLFDIVIAVACEKLNDEGIPGVPIGGGLKTAGSELLATPAGLSAPLATRYMHKYGHSHATLKEALAHIALKNRANAHRNPLAYIQQGLTKDEYLQAPQVAWPLSAYDCAPVVDGASVAIITSAQVARRLKSNFALVKGLGAATSDQLDMAGDPVSLPMNALASRQAYAMAGVKDPTKDMDEFNVHDVTTMMELLCYESLGLCPPGQALKYIESGYFDAEGTMPVNTDGGVQCVGDAVGATGLRSLHEPYLQVTGQAGPRQLKNVRLAAGQTQGGTDAWSSLVTILGARD
jgi:acetyl-CoA C-acetyltransferase